MLTVLGAHQPILLCELVGQSDRIALFEMIRPMGYLAYRLLKGALHPLDLYGDDVAISPTMIISSPAARTTAAPPHSGLIAAPIARS
jgi:hypothetical protein